MCVQPGTKAIDENGEEYYVEWCYEHTPIIMKKDGKTVIYHGHAVRHEGVPIDNEHLVMIGTIIEALGKEYSE